MWFRGVYTLLCWRLRQFVGSVKVGGSIDITDMLGAGGGGGGGGLVGKGSGGIWVLHDLGVLVTEAVDELGKGTEGSRGSLKEGFNLASEGEVVGGVVLNELINRFIKAAEVSHL